MSIYCISTVYTVYRKYPTKGVHPPTSDQIPHSEKKPNGNSSAKAEMGHSFLEVDTRVGRYFLLYILVSYSTVSGSAGGARGENRAAALTP